MAASFRIAHGVKPYGGRRLDNARPDGTGRVVGHVPGATADRVYALADLSPLNVEAIDVMGATRRDLPLSNAA